MRLRQGRAGVGEIAQGGVVRRVARSQPGQKRDRFLQRRLRFRQLVFLPAGVAQAHERERQILSETAVLRLVLDDRTQAGDGFFQVDDRLGCWPMFARVTPSRE